MILFVMLIEHKAYINSHSWISLATCGRERERACDRRNACRWAGSSTSDAFPLPLRSVSYDRSRSRSSDDGPACSMSRAYLPCTRDSLCRDARSIREAYVRSRLGASLQRGWPILIEKLWCTFYSDKLNACLFEYRYSDQSTNTLVCKEFSECTWNW